MATQEPSWKQSEVFPIIARLIGEEHKRHSRYITAQEIATRLLEDSEARVIIDVAREQQRDWTVEHLAANMVAWFSQRITAGHSEWERAFQRTRVDNQWAYMPAIAP